MHLVHSVWRHYSHHLYHIINFHIDNTEHITYQIIFYMKWHNLKE